MSINWEKQNYDWKNLQVFFNDFLFIHIHKTGGSSVKNFFHKGKGDKTSHMMVKSIIKDIGLENFKKYNSFCVVRNPYDLVVSYYSYRTQTGRIEQMSFDDFILNKYFAKVPTQSEYIKYKNQIYCNDILRYETLLSDVEDFIKKYNINLDINNFPHSRKSKRKHYEEYFTNQQILDIVNEYYHEDFELFGYKKIKL